MDKDSATKLTNKNTYDFYKDANVEEVKCAYHTLEDLKIRINDLLDKWPEQPTLKTASFCKFGLNLK